MGLVTSIACNAVLHQARTISALINYEVLGQMEKVQVAMQPSLGSVVEPPPVLTLRCCTRTGP